MKMRHYYHKLCLLVVLVALSTVGGMNLNAQTWNQMQDFNGGNRFGAVGFTIGPFGYMGTGNNGTNVTNDFWRFDPNTGVNGTWTQMANFGGAAREYASAFSIGNVGYVGVGGTAPNVYTGDFWEYDPATNTWVVKQPYGGGARGLAFSFVIGNRGYIGAGSTPGVNLNTVWEYDPTDLSNGTDANGNPMGNWVQRANFAGGVRYGIVGFSVGGLGYAGLGNAGSAYQSDLWEYNPNTDAWTQKTGYPGGVRFMPSSFSIGTSGFVGLGINPPGMTDFWEFDPTSLANGLDGNGNPMGTWIARPPVGGPGRHGVVGLTILGKGYFMTGGFIQDVWQYCDPAILPIELLTFTAAWTDDSYQTVTLDWETVTEINNSHFEIERSTDGINFEHIGTVNGHGTTSSNSSYHILDEDPVMASVSYYRLKQVDYNGNYEYSNIEVLNVPEGLEFINLYPNPSINQFSFLFTSSQDDEVSISIQNNLGQELRRMENSVTAGFNSFDMDVRELSTGNYFIKVITVSGKYSIERKFVKRK